MPDAATRRSRPRAETLLLLPGLSHRGPGLAAGHSLDAALIGTGSARRLGGRTGFAARHPGCARFRGSSGSRSVVLGILAELLGVALRPSRLAHQCQGRHRDSRDKDLHIDTSCWRLEGKRRRSRARSERDVLAGIETGRLRRAVFLSPETRRLALPSWTRGAHMGTGIELFL